MDKSLGTWLPAASRLPAVTPWHPAGVWAAAGPLIEVYNVVQPCPALNLSAQGADGIALQCFDMGGGRLLWAHRLAIPG